MLEICVNQGAGLRPIAMQSRAPRVIAMASHGDQRGELPLLWSLCSTLVELGYSVMVLDDHSVESADNPGLDQLLDDSCWRRDGVSESNSWAVMPAALGFRRIAADASTRGLPLSLLHSVLSNYGVIVIYAPAEVLTRLLPGTGIEPLLTVSPLKMSSVTAYQSLKQMLLNAGLRSTVANIALDGVADAGGRFGSSAQNLQECAMAFLGYRLDSLTIRAGGVEERIADDIHRLTLRLLENAMPLNQNQVGGGH